MPTPTADTPTEHEKIRAREVRGSWPDLVARAAIPARAETSATPGLRAFSLAIGLEHATSARRYLVFHRGGLAASTALRVAERDGRRDVLKIMLAVMLWQGPADAGRPTFTDGCGFELPLVEGKDLARASLRTCLYHSRSVRGRGTWVGALDLSSEGALPAKETDPKTSTCCGCNAPSVGTHGAC